LLLYAVRWLPPSLYTCPCRGLAWICQYRVRRLRERSRTSFPTWCPASAPSCAARVRRVASYTKGQCTRLRSLASEPGRESFYLEPQARSIQTITRSAENHVT